MYTILVLVLTLLATLYAYLWHKCNYWRRRGVPQLSDKYPLADVAWLISVSLREPLHELYKRYKGQSVIAGFYIYTKPQAVLLDLELVKAILIKDFNKFRDRTIYRNEENDPLSGHLFSIGGDKWRPLRTKLTPTFTSGKMKYMFPTILQVASEFEHTFEREVKATADGVVDLHDLMARFTTDVIGNCILGIECNSLSDTNHGFRAIGRALFDASKRPPVPIMQLRITYAQFLKHFGLKIFSQEVESFFMRLVRETVELRERDNIKRNDFMELLIELKNTKDAAGKPGLTIEQMAAQVFVFFLAGFETSSSNTSYALFELAKRPAIQEQLREEINTVLERHEGMLTYEAMSEMHYLDQVIYETLRMHPALAALTRFAGEDYKLPGTNITLEQGTRVMIPVKEIHYDPEIYAEPHEFRPERFSSEEVKLRHPQAFLGFGDGPRNCIGLRFGRMQVRIALIKLLTTYRFHLAERTPKKLPVTKISIILTPSEGVWLRAEKITET